MAGQDPGCRNGGEPVERRQRALRLIGERRRLRPVASGQHVTRRQRVADEHRVDGRHVDRNAARRVPRHPDDHGRSWELQHVAVGDLHHLGHGRRAQRALADAVREESEHRSEARRAHRGLGLLARADAMRVGGVDVDRHPRFAAQPLGEPDVVAVAVGQHDAADVGQRSADLRELALQVAPVPRHPGVDESDALRQVDQVGGDDVVAQAVQVRCELHGGPFGCDGYVT